MNLKTKTRTPRIKVMILSLALFCCPWLNLQPSTYAKARTTRQSQSANTQITANCAFSVGPWCICAYHLQRHKLRFQAAPLDWSGCGGRYGVKEPYSLKSVAKLFKTRFDDFFKDTKVVPDKLFNNYKRIVFDTKNNIEYHNDFEISVPFEEAKKEFREIMLRRAEKVDDIMKKSDAIALVSCRNSTKEEFVDFIKKFSKIYPNKKIYLINVRNVNSNKITRHILYSEGNLKVIEYRFKNEGKGYNWRGNFKGWDEVMKSIKLVRK